MGSARRCGCSCTLASRYHTTSAQHTRSLHIRALPPHRRCKTCEEINNRSQRGQNNGRLISPAFDKYAAGNLRPSAVVGGADDGALVACASVADQNRLLVLWAGCWWAVTGGGGGGGGERRWQAREQQEKMKPCEYWWRYNAMPIITRAHAKQRELKRFLAQTYCGDVHEADL